MDRTVPAVLSPATKMQLMNSKKFDEITALCKRKGFIFQSSEIYGGLGATYDYGPLGVELKRNVQKRWWHDMVYANDNIEGVDAAILMHPKVWKASGHVDAFHDPLIDDKVSKRRYRADQLIEQHIDRLKSKGKTAHADAVQKQFTEALNAEDMPKALHTLILSEEIRSPDSGAFDWTDVRQFNMMFETRVGALASEDSSIFLRPETAQGIFVNVQNVLATSRVQIPFGIAQIGKAFRNEIVARQFIFRMREFEQMEMQYFVQPGTQQDAYELWRERRWDWHLRNGIPPSKLRWHVHEKPAHYADAAVDIQYEFPIGWQEIEGIHSRTDYDLKRHQEYSGKKMQIFHTPSGSRFVPFVVETSAGLDRTVLMLLCEAYRKDTVGEENRTVMGFAPSIAPIKAAIFPLMRKDDMPERARTITKELRRDWNVFYDEKGSIGKRYRRMDEAGTPLCITIDNETLNGSGVTIRSRDTLEQIRIADDQVSTYVSDFVRGA